MISIWREALSLIDERQEFCVATIVSIEGSSPRHVGAKFLVKKNGATVGTIGGGVFEAEVIKVALDALQKQFSTVMHFAFRGENAFSDKMICGGSANVLIEYHDSFNHDRRAIFENLVRLNSERLSGYLVTKIPDQVGYFDSNPFESLFYDETGHWIGNLSNQATIIRELNSKKLLGQAQLVNSDHMECLFFIEHFAPEGTVYIFGAGHVGVCVAHLASYVGFRVTLIDDREEYANHARVPQADHVVVVDDFDNCLPLLNVGQDSYVVIVTRGHSHDKTVLSQVLQTQAHYVGMIGSKRKIKLIFDALLEDGMTESQLERVHSPIGLPIGGETPEEIAVSIVAELIQCKQANSGNKKITTCMSG